MVGLGCSPGVAFDPWPHGRADVLTLEKLGIYHLLSYPFNQLDSLFSGFPGADLVNWARTCC